MHCHIELHNLDGMAMTILEAPDQIPETPRGFPKCGNFHYDESSGQGDENGESEEDEDEKSKENIKDDKNKHAGKNSQDSLNQCIMPINTDQCQSKFWD